MQSISLSIVGCLSCTEDNLQEKKATAFLFCSITAPDCRSDASVWMLQGTFKSGNARRTFSAMKISTASKAKINSSVGWSLPLDCPDSAVGGAIKSAWPFQKD